MMDKTPEGFLKEEEVCKLLNVSKKYLQRLRQRNDGPRFVQLHYRLYLYREKDVTEWILTMFNKQNGIKKKAS